MSHPQQLFFVSSVKQFFPSYFKNASVLEVGSLDINGSVRQFFENCQYNGLDVGPGAGVDTVCPGQDFGAPANAFDVVISCEMMEHNPQWRKTFINMLRILKPEGLMILTFATVGRRQHGTQAFNPNDSPLANEQNRDYYKNLVQSDIESLVVLDQWFSIWGFHQDCTSYDLYFFGLGSEADFSLVEGAKELNRAFDNFYYHRNILGIY